MRVQPSLNIYGHLTHSLQIHPAAALLCGVISSEDQKKLGIVYVLT
jgi:hypothetical protein